MQTRKLILSVPPSVNRMYRVFRGRVFMVKQGKEYKQQVAKQAKAQGFQKPFSGSVRVEVDVYRKAKRGDLDNFLKCLLDGMQGVMYKNDKQIIQLVARRHDDKLNPRVEVSVCAI